MYRKQFLLTKDNCNFSNLKKQRNIGDFFLYIGNDSEYCFSIRENAEFHMLGSIYDWENPDFSNKDILADISQKQSLDEILNISNKYCGEFILIVKLLNDFFILNDATGQKEIYYNNEFTCFGSQPKILGLSIDLLDHNSEDEKEYYYSLTFKKKCLFVGNTTHKRNVFHLTPNHILKIKEKRIQRFFPDKVLYQGRSLHNISKNAAEMLKGYIKAVAKRNKIRMALTGGYDSRVLFLASLEVECDYYVLKHSYMSHAHYDIYIPKQLTSYYNKKFTVEDERKDKDVPDYKHYTNDIDFPRFLYPNMNDNVHVYINGNISEIARNFFGYHSNASAKDLSFLSGNSTMSFVVKEYRRWLKDKSLFQKYGYHYLDMFYWEEKMGNWAAKSKTESNALGRTVISPFNSRDLLTLLLSTKRKDRDSHFNHLYDLILYDLSGKNNEISKIPINPCMKQNIIRIMKYFRIYNIYRAFGLKNRTL